MRCTVHQKILLIPSVALSFVALFSSLESDSRVTALLATSVALHCVGFLDILQGPFFFIMRKSSFSSAMGVVLTLLFTAFVISMAADSILAQEKSSPSQYRVLLHVISQSLLTVSIALSGASFIEGDGLAVAIRIASTLTDAVTLLLTFHLPYRFMLRMTNLLVVSAFLFTMVLAGFGLLIASDQYAYYGLGIG